jgi:MFS family permease
MLGLLPGLSYILTQKLRLSSKDKDLVLAKCSIVLLVFGALLIAASDKVGLTIIGLMVWTFGTGFVSLVRSLITTLVDEQHVGHLYAAVSIVETIGTLAAGSMLAGLYNLGLRWQGPWVGLPFLLLSIVSFLAGIEIWIFGNITRKSRREDVLGNEDEQNAQNETLLLEPDPPG